MRDDGLLVFAGSASPRLGQEIGEYLGQGLAESEVIRFAIAHYRGALAIDASSPRFRPLACACRFE